MEDGQPVAGSIYFYAPDKGGPIFFTIAFAVSGCFHLWQCIRYKCFKVTSLHPITCLLFVVGYALRVYGSFHYEYNDVNVNIYIASVVFIYSAPPILELANYHVLGRILYYVPYLSPIHPGRTLTTFGMLSSIVEMLNGLGVSWIANPAVEDSMRSVGRAMLKASLLLQIVVITLFVILVALFHCRCAAPGREPHLRRVSGPLLTMYISTAVILVRCIYRTVEYFYAADVRYFSNVDALSPLVRYEWFFYVFEASLMLVSEVLWNVRFPMRGLPRDYHVYLAQDGVTEVKGDGWVGERSFTVTLLDPFEVLKLLGLKSRRQEPL